MTSKKKRLVRPLGDMVLLIYDGLLSKTSGGIMLPDTAQIETLTGRIIAVPERMKGNEMEFPFQELDHVIYDTRYAIPIDLEPNNKHFLINYVYLYAIVPSDDDDEEAPREREAALDVGR